MSTRNIDTQIRYLIQITEKGLQQAIALTKDLGVQSKTTQAGVDASMKAVQTQYNALAKVAASADSAVAKAAIDSAVSVNKALDSQIAKLRDAGASYTAIIAKQKELGASAAELASAVRRSSEQQIASMRAVRAEADKLSIGQRLGAVGSRIGGAAAGAASTVGGGLLAGAGIAGALAYTGLEKSRGVIEGTLAIRGATGLPTNQAVALSTIATSLGIAPRSIGQAFGTLGGRTTQALAGNATSGALFSTLGISRATVARNVDNPLALFDLVTQRAATLPATQQAAVQRSLLGRGSSIVGQLTAGGPLTASVAEVEKNLPGLDPKKLIAMQEAFVHLKEVSTAFELSFAQSFGPSIGAALNAITPLLPKVAAGFKDAFGFIKGVVDGPVGQALGKFGTMAFDAGKKLVEAFKPAMPFFQNVLLPLVKGLAIGIGIGLIGAINLVTAGVKILAPIFGALGDALKPLKTVIQDVGVVLGVVFSGDALGAIFKGIGAVVGEIPLLGKALDFLIRPIEIVGSGIGKLYDIIAGTFSKIFGFIPGVGSKLASLLGGLAASIVGAFAAVPDAVGSIFSSIGTIIEQALVSAINAGIDVINAGTGAVSSVTSALGLGSIGQIQHLTVAAAPVAPSTTKHGTFREGGLVPAMVSPQEQVIYGGQSWMVPGSPTAADSVFAMLPAGAAVMTGHGQALMGMGASLDQALAMQAPHFAAGGTVNALGWNVKPPKGAGGSKATPRYINHQLVGNFTQAGWQAYQLAHPKGLQPSWKTVIASVYDDSTATSSGKHYPHGFAELSPPGTTSGQVNFDTANVLGRLPYGTTVSVRRGPGSPIVTAQKDDIGRGSGSPPWAQFDMGLALTAAVLGGSSTSFKGPVQISSGLAGASVKQLGLGKAAAAPTLANAIASLTGQTAFGGGFQAGLSGSNLIDTLRSGVLSQLIGDVAISQGAQAGVAGALKISAAQQSFAGGKLVPPGSRLTWNRIDQGQDITTTPGGPLLAMGAGKIIDTPNNPGGFGFNYPVMTYSTGPFAKRSVYYGHTHSVLGAGSPFRAGQVISKTGFGTSREGNATVPGWAEIGFWPPGGMNAGAAISPALHRIMGMRRGGTVGITRRPRVDPLAQPLRGVSALLSQSDATDVSAIMGLLASELDNVHALTFQNLQALAASLMRHPIKGLDTIQQRRLSTAINLVDAAIGNRIGLSVYNAQQAVDSITRGNAHKAALSTLSGVDSGSTKGLQLAVQLDQAVVQGLNAQVGTLNQALATAKKYGDKATIKAVTDQLNTALGNLDQAAIQAMNDLKASIERAAQDTVDQASQAVSVAQAGEGILGLQQQLAGTDQTPGGGQQIAAYINGTVIPAFRAQLAAQQADQAAAASVGDTARVNADILSELQTQTSILTESKTAQDAIKTNTNTLKTQGGQLAFQFQGSNFTDLAALGAGS